MSYRYPAESIRYKKVVGQTRVTNLINILSREGYRVISDDIENHGVDLKVYDDSGLFLVIEVTNWRRRSYMCFVKAESVKSNFRRYSCKKLLVCSFEENYRRYRNYFDANMDIIEIGFQTNPWYYWFREQGRDTSDLRPNDAETLDILRHQILAYLNDLS
jgi:hypothetical protein